MNNEWYETAERMYDIVKRLHEDCMKIESSRQTREQTDGWTDISISSFRQHKFTKLIFLQSFKSSCDKILALFLHAF